MEQLIHELINIIGEASCVDLVFASKPSLVIETVAHSSLHDNCHHHILVARFSLHISITNAKFGILKKQIWYRSEKQSSSKDMKVNEIFDFINPLTNNVRHDIETSQLI